MRVVTVILADDIRVENTGKELLIGVYSGAITVPAFPADIRVGVYALIEGIVLGIHDLQFRLTFPAANGQRKFGVKVEAAGIQEPGQQEAVFANGLPMRIERAGNIDISFKVGEDWQLVRSFPVTGPEARIIRDQPVPDFRDLPPPP